MTTTKPVQISATDALAAFDVPALPAPDGDRGVSQSGTVTVDGIDFRITRVTMPNGSIRLFARYYNGYGDGGSVSRAFDCAWSVAEVTGRGCTDECSAHCIDLHSDPTTTSEHGSAVDAILRARELHDALSVMFDLSTSTLDMRDFVEYLDRAEQDPADLDDECGEGTSAVMIKVAADMARALGAPDIRDYAQNEPTMIHESYRVEYAQEYAEDVCGYGGERVTTWPFNHIDWEAAADDLFSDDWSTVEVGESTYYVRNY